MQLPAYILLLNKTALACIWLGLLLYFPVCSAQEKILAVISHDSQLYQSFYEKIKSKVNAFATVEKTQIGALNDKELSKYNIVISIGSDAAEVLSRTANINHLIHTLIPRSLANKISDSPCLASKCQSVLIEQPTERYFQLFKQIFPARKKLVVAFTDGSYSKQQLTLLAKKYDIRFTTIQINQGNTIARTLIKTLDEDDVLLALPDPAIYNKNTAKSIILSSYHKNVPIIAYSQAFAKAGALVSLYSSLDNIADQTTKLIPGKYTTNKVAFYPTLYSIEFNDSVAKSLNISITDINNLMRNIK